MKDQLTAAPDADRALAIFKAAMGNDLPQLKAIYGDGSNAALDKLQVVLEPALNINMATLSVFKLLNVQAMGEHLNAALYMSAYRGHDAIVDFLLEKGDVDQRSLDAALFGAAQTGRLDLFKKIEAAGANTAFDNHLCLTDSVAEGRMVMADYILSKNTEGAASAALVAYIDNNRLSRAEDAVFEVTEHLPALEAITRALSDRRVLRGLERAAGAPEDYLNLFDTILSFNEGYGNNVPQLLDKALLSALDQWSPRVILRILAHEQFENIPEKDQKLSAILALAAFAPGQGLGIDREVQEELIEKLLELGVSAEAALKQGVADGNADVTALGLRFGAEPRGEVLAQARMLSGGGHAAVLIKLEAEEQRRDSLEWDHFKSGIGAVFNAAALRRKDDATGHTGLQLAAAAGEGAEALAVLKAAAPAITAEELLAKDAFGRAAIDMLARKGQVEPLLDAPLWYAREAEYKQVFAALPDDVQEKFAGTHHDLLSALKVQRDTAALRQGKKRWDLK